MPAHEPIRTRYFLFLYRLCWPLSQVYLSLLPDMSHNILDGVYFVWSIFHLFLRGVSIAMSTILIHEYSHWPVKDIQKLRSEQYEDKDVIMTNIKRLGSLLI